MLEIWVGEHLPHFTWVSEWVSEWVSGAEWSGRVYLWCHLRQGVLQWWSDIVTLLSHYERVISRRFVTNTYNSIADFIALLNCQTNWFFTIPHFDCITKEEILLDHSALSPRWPPSMHACMNCVQSLSAAQQIIAVTSSGQWLNPSLPFPSTLMCKCDYKKFRELLPATRIELSHYKQLIFSSLKTSTWPHPRTLTQTMLQLFCVDITSAWPHPRTLTQTTTQLFGNDITHYFPPCRPKQ